MASSSEEKNPLFIPLPPLAAEIVQGYKWTRRSDEFEVAGNASYEMPCWYEPRGEGQRGVTGGAATV